MAETIKVHVPLTGSNVVREGGAGPDLPPESAPRAGWENGVYVPPSKPPSLHQTSAQFRDAIRRQQGPLDYEPVWNDRNGKFEFRAVPAERQAEVNASPPSQAEALQQQLNELNAAVLNLATKQLGGQMDNEQYQYDNQQYGSDAADFDPFDPASVSAYVERAVQQGVASALGRHQGVMNELEITRDYNATVGKYGRDENFEEVMEMVVKEIEEGVKNGKRLSVLETYQRMNDREAARPGQRSAHVPMRTLPNGKKAHLGLGGLMLHNRLSGRAAPPRKRGR